MVRLEAAAKETGKTELSSVGTFAATQTCNSASSAFSLPWDSSTVA